MNDFTFTFHFHALEKEMATHSSVLAWVSARQSRNFMSVRNTVFHLPVVYQVVNHLADPARIR